MLETNLIHTDTETFLKNMVEDAFKRAGIAKPYFLAGAKAVSGYNIFENMQILTWEENNLKGRDSEKNKTQMREMTKLILSKPVLKFNIKNNDVIERFDSVREAGRQLNIDSSTISKCCRGEIKSYKGFGWKYE